jgi:hypothetical protein
MDTQGESSELIMLDVAFIHKCIRIYLFYLTMLLIPQTLKHGLAGCNE